MIGAPARNDWFCAGSLAAALLVFSPHVLSAQSSSPVGGRVFVEAGRSLSTSDAAERQTILPSSVASPRQESDALWSISGGAMLGRQWGIGVEWRAPADVTMSGGRAVLSYDETGRERSTFALAIARPVQWPLGTIELVGGPGFVRQRIEQTFVGCNPGTECRTRTMVSSATLAALTFGANGVLKVASHVALVGFTRATSTRRAVLSSGAGASDAALVWTCSAGLAIRGWL